MSIPPQLIRIKRKRDDETPVTFLQFDKEAKRHRSQRNWVYQRRQANPPSQPDVPVKRSRDVEPVIHVSPSNGESSPAKGPAPTPSATSATPGQARDGASPEPTARTDQERDISPRRFHISRKLMMPTSPAPSGVSKKIRYGPAVFVERSRAKLAQNALQGMDTPPKQNPSSSAKSIIHADASRVDVKEPVEEERRLKKPGATARGRSPRPESISNVPLPESAMNPHKEDMSKIAHEMNQWVMKEIGANLQGMEQEKQLERQRFKPKAPAQRYQQRHPEIAPTTMARDNEANMNMDMDIDDASEDGDWVYEEYVRVPAHAMMPDVAPADVGVLVLEGEEDSQLFYGPEQDDEDDLDEDEEDENAENYYTADYPEDEVESDDEYGRHPYGYRAGNASDDEEFDNELADDTDDDIIVEGGDDDATMARIKAYMRRSRGFQ